MSSFKEPIRDYSFTDARLIEIALEKIAFAGRDATELATVGVTAAWVNNLNDKVLAFGALPSDVVELGEQEEATDEKNADADALRDKLKELRSAAVRAFGEKHADYKQFGLKELDDMSDAQLLKAAMVAHGVAATHAAPLATKGYDAADNTALQTLITNYVGGIQNQGMEVSSRDSATENRIVKGNELYDLLENELCEAGKGYWRTLSEAKYNDYIIYNNASGSDTDGYDVQNFVVPAGGSILFPLNGPGIPANLDLYLKALTGSVWVCSTNLPASPCAGGYELVEGNRFKGVITPLGLDLTKTHIQFSNPGLTDVTVKAGTKSE